jgi:hypothetical protein
MYSLTSRDVIQLYCIDIVPGAFLIAVDYLQKRKKKKRPCRSIKRALLYMNNARFYQF